MIAKHHSNKQDTLYILDDGTHVHYTFGAPVYNIIKINGNQEQIDLLQDHPIVNAIRETDWDTDRITNARRAMTPIEEVYHNAYQTLQSKKTTTTTHKKNQT